MVTTDTPSTAGVGLSLVLYRYETYAIGYVRELFYIIDLSSAPEPKFEELASPPERLSCIDLTPAEAQQLAHSQNLFCELFARFGIQDLRDYPGMPKGPYYSISQGVLDTLRALGTVVQTGSVSP